MHLSDRLYLCLCVRWWGIQLLYHTKGKEYGRQMDRFNGVVKYDL